MTIPLGIDVQRHQYHFHAEQQRVWHDLRTTHMEIKSEDAVKSYDITNEDKPEGGETSLI